MAFLGDEISDIADGSFDNTVDDEISDIANGSSGGTQTSSNSTGGSWDTALQGLLTNVENIGNQYYNAKQTAAMAPLTIINEVMVGAAALAAGIIIYKIIASNNKTKIKIARS
jgi:hypothetical protein